MRFGYERAYTTVRMKIKMKIEIRREAEVKIILIV